MRLASLFGMATSVILSHPLDADDAQRAGLQARNYAVSEVVTVEEWVAGALLRSGYARPTSQPGAASLLTGQGAPDAGIGSEGFWYLDTLSKVLYGPKTGGTWPSGTLAPGRTITGATVNASGHLIVRYSDGAQVDAGLVQGPPGAPGTPGEVSNIDDFVAQINDGQSPVGGALRAAFVPSEHLPINVRERGLDRAALQTAVDDAVAEGRREVEIPAGEYLGSSPLALTAAHNGLAIFSRGRAVLRNAPGANASVITLDGTQGARLSGLECDGARDDQTEAFDVIFGIDTRDCLFDDLTVYGGLRTGTFPAVSRFGDGLELIRDYRSEIRGGLSRDNTYDGYKLRHCRYTKIIGATARNNGRSGLQMAYDSVTLGTGASGDETTAPMFCTITGLTVEHDTGIPSAAAPTTTGVYFHTASRNAVTGLVVYGTEQVVGFYDNSNRNVVTGAQGRVRATGGGKAAVEFEKAPATANEVIGGVFSGIGANGKLLATAGVDNGTRTGRNLVMGCLFELGEGTGTWTVAMTGNTGAPNRYIHNENLTGTSLDLGVGVVAEYVSGGALVAKGQSGTLTTLAAAT